MTAAATPKLAAYAGLAACGLLGALALGRPELAVVAAPFAAMLVAGLTVSRAPAVSVAVSLERDAALEGDELATELVVRAEPAVARLELFLALPPGLAVRDGPNPVALHVPADEPRDVELTLACDRWGAYTVGHVFVRARDRLGLVAYESEVERAVPLKVYPRPEALRDVLRPLETQALVGNEVARAKGDGMEFADIRPFAPGDRVRRVNWRASARRGAPYVNEHHPERNTDVVLFLDSFAEAARAGTSTLDLAVKAAASLAARYLERRDRVGLISFGGVLRWLAPGMGLVQRYRIVDALPETEIVFSYAWKALDVIPTRTLPPNALVVAITPLLDARSVAALLDLRGRGFDLAVVEVSPVPFARPGPSAVDELAYRLWELRRAELRSRFERLGAAVGEWREDVPLAGVLEGVREFRRHARRSAVA